MGIAEQFAGLDMANLIGGPLTAASDANINLAKSTAEFINKIGFDKDGKVLVAVFKFEKCSVNEDGTSNLEERKVDVPMLAIVPIPNLQIDEVNILFDMEVKESKKEEKSMDMEAKASLNGQPNFGIVKVNIKGSVSSHTRNPNKSGNSPKYHVDVHATNHGTPEGLEKVLDMMAANVAPSLVSTTVIDPNGNDMQEKERQKEEYIKALRQEIISKHKREEASLSYKKIVDDVQEIWNNTQDQITDTIRQMALEKVNKDTDSQDT